MAKRYSTPGPRSIYPTICTSLPVAGCSLPAQLLFDRLITQADDQGRLVGDPRSVRATCMPLVEEATPETVEGWLVELAGQGLILRYGEPGRQYVQIAGWWEHQGSMRRAYGSRYPSPEGWADRSYGMPGRRRSAAKCGEVRRSAA